MEYFMENIMPILTAAGPALAAIAGILLTFYKIAVLLSNLKQDNDKSAKINEETYRQTKEYITQIDDKISKLQKEQADLISAINKVKYNDKNL